MQIMALQFSAAVLIVSAIGLIQSNASITYVDIIDESKLGKFVNLTESDFSSNITEVDTKPIIMTHLAGSGSQLTSDVMNFLGNPLQGSGKLEGDIELPPGSKLLHSDTNYTTLAYSAIVDRRLFWVDAVIPYTISEAYGRYSRAQIAKAIIEIKRSTCLKLIPWSNQDDYIAIRPALGCSSHVGRMGGKQVVSISAGCTQKVTIIHELMHAAGFYHEQARHDRDEYVVIHWQNIDPIPEIKAQFEKRDISTVTVLGMPYDQRSIMHYRSTAFAKSPGLVTITALNGGEVSNDDGMTQLDIAKLNKLYQCNENDAEVTTGSSTTTATTTTTTISKLTTKSLVYSGHTVAFGRNRTWLTCNQDSRMCAQNDCAGEAMEWEDWDRCAGLSFVIIAVGSETDEDAPIRYGDTIQLQTPDGEYSLRCGNSGDHCSLSKLQDRNAGDTDDRFVIFAPEKRCDCETYVHKKCRGEAIASYEMIFLWHHGRKRGRNYFLYGSDGGIKTGRCPGKRVQNFDMFRCPHEMWQIFPHYDN